MLYHKIIKLIANPALQSLTLMGMRGTLLVVKFGLTLFIAGFLDFEALGLFGLLAAAGVAAPSVLGLGIMYHVARNAVTQSKAEISEELLFYGKFMIGFYLLALLIGAGIGLAFDRLFLTAVGILIICLEHLAGEFYVLFLNLSRPFVANFYHFIRAAAWALIYMPLAYFYPALRTIEALFLFWLAGAALATGLYVKTFGFERKVSGLEAVSDIKKFCKKVFAAKTVYAFTLVTALSQYIDRYIVGLFLGLELTGVYVFFWQIASALNNLLATGVIQLYRPKLVRAFKEKSVEYKSVLLQCMKKSLTYAVIFACVAGFALDFLLPYLQKPLLQKYEILIIYTLIGFVLSVIAEVLTLVFYSRHADRLEFITRASIFLWVITVNTALIYYNGVEGAATAFCIYGLFSIIIRVYFIKKRRFLTVFY